jgi:hypothetical protein
MLDEASAGFIATLAASGLKPLHELSPQEAREAGSRTSSTVAGRAGTAFRAWRTSSSVRCGCGFSSRTSVLAA